MLISKRNLLLLIEAYVINEEKKDEEVESDQAEEDSNPESGGLDLGNISIEIKDLNLKPVGKVELVNPDGTNKIDVFVSKDDNQKTKLTLPDEIKTAIIGSLNSAISNQNSDSAHRENAVKWINTVVQGGIDNVKSVAKHRHNLKTNDLIKILQKKLG
mgnify:CR=1 FL=1